MIIAGTVFCTVLLICVTTLIYQHRSFGATRYAEVREQIKATQMAVAEINKWQRQIATYLKLELSKPRPDDEQAGQLGKRT